MRFGDLKLGIKYQAFAGMEPQGYQIFGHQVFRTPHTERPYILWNFRRSIYGLQRHPINPGWLVPTFNGEATSFSGYYLLSDEDGKVCLLNLNRIPD